MIVSWDSFRLMCSSLPPIHHTIDIAIKSFDKFAGIVVFVRCGVVATWTTMLASIYFLP